MELVGLLRPQRFQGRHGIRPTLVEEIAEPEKVARLKPVRLIVDHGFKRWNSFIKFVLPVISQTQVEPDAGNCGR